MPLPEGDDQAQKLLILMEGLKSSLADANESEIASLDLTDVLDSTVSLADFDIGSVTANLPPSELKDEAEAVRRL